MEPAPSAVIAPPAVEERPERWSSSTTMGLMGFALTTMLAGLSNLPPPYGNGFAQNWVVFGMAMAFGGSTQFIAGIIALRKGNMFAGTAFVGYGAFWIAFTFMLATYLQPYAPINAATGTWVGYYGIAGFMFVWALFTFAFLINAPKHGWGITGVFTFLFVTFCLLTAKFCQYGGTSSTGVPSISNGEAWAIGIWVVLTGLMAFYVGMADLTNWNYGRKVLPT